jgi:hypothetical protein
MMAQVPHGFFEVAPPVGGQFYRARFSSVA